MVRAVSETRNFGISPERCATSPGKGLCGEWCWWRFVGLKVSRRSGRRSPHDNVALCQGENKPLALWPCFYVPWRYYSDMAALVIGGCMLLLWADTMAVSWRQGLYLSYSSSHSAPFPIPWNQSYHHHGYISIPPLIIHSEETQARSLWVWSPKRLSLGAEIAMEAKLLLLHHRSLAKFQFFTMFLAKETFILNKKH